MLISSSYLCPQRLSSSHPLPTNHCFAAMQWSGPDAQSLGLLTGFCSGLQAVYALGLTQRWLQLWGPSGGRCPHPLSRDPLFLS